jgi:hypothetical protein
MNSSRRGGTKLLNCASTSKAKGDAHYGGPSHISGDGRHALWGRIFLLSNSIKNIVNRIFSTECLLRQHAMCPLAHIRACMCSNGHPMGPAQEAPRGAQAV